MRLSDRSLRRLAWSAFVLFLLVVAVDIALSAAASADSTFATAGATAGFLGFMLLIASFPAVGVVIVLNQPRNRIGWLLLAIGAAWTASGLLDIYATWALAVQPDTAPGGYVALAVLNGSWVPGVALMGIWLILLFPDGRLPSPRWRWLSRVTVMVMVLGPLALTLAPGRIDFEPEPDGIENPLGVESLAPLLDILVPILLGLLPCCMVAAAVSLVLRFRRARGAERLQLKWLTTAGAFVAVSFVVGMTLSVPAVRDGLSISDTAMDLIDTVSFLSFLLVPVAVGVAVSRHGLYGIDAVISRALVVGALGVFITGVYVAIVVGVGALIGQQGPSVALSVVATAVVAVAFQPVRERVQRWVNRWVYGERATPYEVLADFASRVTGRYTTAELLPRLAETVSEGLGGARVEVWVRTGDDLVREVSWPAGMEPAEPVHVGANASLPLAGDRVVAVRHREELLGALVVTKPAGETVTPPEEAMLEQVATQAGLVLRNLRLIDDLKSSRVRLVASQDTERRRLERNLHDGAQQSLVSVALLTRMAAARASDPEVKKSLSDAGEQLQAAIDELRELARGIHPVVLTERGLGPALNSLAERAQVPVLVEADLRDRLPEAVEATLYLVAAETIRNAARHAGAGTVRVRVVLEDGDVRLEVVDDGAEGADPSVSTGLHGLGDRVAAVDGVIEVDSSVGEGTRIMCRVPVATARSAVLEEIS